MNENFDLLKQLYCIHSKSGNEKKMCKFLRKWIFSNISNVNIEQDNSGNMYITKGKSETYPCLIAHLDQVQHNHSKDFVVIESDDILCGYSPKCKAFQGLGADDKNGIWVSLMCLEKYDNLKCAFFIGEEVGCVGSNKADLQFFDDCRYCLQIDRRGSSDLITEISSQLCSEEFIKDVDCETWGYSPTNGLMTDVDTLRDNGLEISCVNMSCGYYKPHTDEEYTIKADLLKCLRFVEHIIEDCCKVYKFEYVEPYSRYGKYFYGSYGDDYSYKLNLNDEKETEREAFEEELYCAIYNDEVYNEKTYDEFLCSIDGIYTHLKKEDFDKVWEDLQIYVGANGDYYDF